MSLFAWPTIGYSINLLWPEVRAGIYAIFALMTRKPLVTGCSC